MAGASNATTALRAPRLAGDNLLAGIRDPALYYFDEHQIRWWLSRAEEAE